MVRYSKDDVIKAIREFHNETGSFSPDKYKESGFSPSVRTAKRRFGSWPNAVDKSGISHDYIGCPNCDEFFISHLGMHWNSNPSHRPEITSRRKEILIGCLMGDGSCSLPELGQNPIMSVTNSNMDFLYLIDEEMGTIGANIVLNKSAEEVAEEFDADVEDCKDVYQWISRTHDGFKEFRDWYSTGQKRFPDNLKLTPLILKYWYCGDGTMREEDGPNSRPSLQIGAGNEVDRTGYLEGIFQDIGVSPRFNISDGKYGKDMNVCFRVDDSEELWNYMGEPLPGFEYKWPENYRN